MNPIAPWKHWLVRYVADPAICLLFGSCKWQIEGLEAFLKSCESEPVLLSLWHESLLMMPYFVGKHMSHLPISALISKSRDGRLIESLGKRLTNVDTIHVAHDSKHVSMKRMMEALEQQRVVCLTPDGPQGPWKKIKPGVLQTAYLSKAKLWALTWEKSHSEFNLPTPDQMRLPKPFQRITVRLTCLGSLEQKDQFAHYQARLENVLN